VTRLAPPDEVARIVATLEEAGFETWCVGGAVRDALLGHPGLDWDVATAASPGEVRRLFRRTVPVGIEHGTVGVLDRAGRMHEVTTFRRDVRTDGRHAVVEFGASLDEDLARRDFTINAIAYSPSRDELRDPFDGRGDLERRVLRAVGDPAARMAEDRLRALRAIRFAARFAFRIEPRTWEAIVASAPHLGRLSAERVKQELEKTMEQVARPGSALALWRDAGALATLVPDLGTLDDRWLEALDCLAQPGLSGRPRRKLDRLAMLFLSLGGAGAGRTARALRFSNADAAWIAALADRWARLGGEMSAALTGGDVAPDPVRRWAAIAGRTRLGPLLRLAAAVWAADRSAGRPAPPGRAVRALYRRALRVAYRDAIEIGDLAVDGDDLRRAGIPPGPMLGRILHDLLELVLADPALNVRERLLQLALEIHPRLAGGPSSQSDR
jgi:tRNA nucleotidyltransferase (CCA-adding enzyme)